MAWGQKNSGGRKEPLFGLPVEVWTRFMKAAHQGVPVATIPNSQGNWGPANLIQVSSQVTAPSAPVQMPMQIQAPSPQPPAPTAPAAGSYYRPPPPTRASAQANPNARPEAAAGLDGWLTDRLFGGRR